MRRFAVFALAATTATGLGIALGATAASAHICPVADEIAVGQSATISVGVTVEGATVPDVEIRLPAGLRLDRVEAADGWTSTRSGSTVRYHGGPIPPYACKYFSLAVTAPAKGSFGVTVVQRSAAGTVVSNAVPDPNNPTDRLLDQYVYAGVKPPLSGSPSKGLSPMIIGGIVVVGLGIAMAVVLFVRGRRARDAADRPEEPDAELQRRLTRFKERTSDPRPPD